MAVEQKPQTGDEFGVAEPAMSPQQRRQREDRRQMTFTAEDRRRIDEVYQWMLGQKAAQPGTPKQIGYRCIEVIDKREMDENDQWTGRIKRERCGMVVKAGSHEERARTGEVVRCPNPAHRGQLTEMEPIL